LAPNSGTLAGGSRLDCSLWLQHCVATRVIQIKEEPMKTVTQINFLSIKPEKIDEFFEVDRSYVASASLPKGLIGSRLYRSPDGRSVVRVSQYESVEAQKEYHLSGALRQQIKKLSALVESSNPTLYEEVYTTGDFK
jgi:heme-degrading monooxygenase HmoA